MHRSRHTHRACWSDGARVAQVMRTTSSIGREARVNGAVTLGRPGALSPGSLLARLRGDVNTRPVVDPGLAWGLRDWLEDELSEAAALLPDESVPVRVHKDALNQVLVCEAHCAGRTRSRPLTVDLARGLMVDCLFRQWVTVGQITDPWEDACAGMECDGGGEVVRFVDALDPATRGRLIGQVREQASAIASAWPVSNPGWLARTQERIEVPLAGGRLVFSGVIDLAFGTPCAGRASVCLVELKSGVRRLEHRGDLHFYALLETLRSGAPPFRIATYYSSTGELDAEQVGEDVLLGAMHRTLAGAKRLCRLACGDEPRRTPNPLCAWCAELPSCPPGQERAQSGVPRATAGPGADEIGFGADDLGCAIDGTQTEGLSWEEDES